MPRYDYQCAKCKNTFEVQLSFAEADTARPKCPKCGSQRVRRKINTGQIARKKSNYRLTADQVQAAANLAGLNAPAGDDDHAGHNH